MTVTVPVPVREGDVIAGKYLIRRVLGAGAMGVVVAAEHMQLNRLVALKFLHSEACESESAVSRFLREGQILARVTSPHVAQVIDVGTLERGEPYIVMEYLQGLDMGAVIRERGRLPISEAVSYVLQACEGVAEAHACGIVHRDLKPSNLFLAESANGPPLVKVLDFGISKAVAASGSAPATYDNTSTGALVGSPQYMSPEQMRNAKHVDQRTDIWSLGVILHEVLACSVPFRGETLAGILAAIAADPPIPIRTLRPDVPVPLEAIILKCLRKNRNARYATVAELSRDLKPFAAGDARQSLLRIEQLFSRLATQGAIDSSRDFDSTSESIPTWEEQRPKTPNRAAARKKGIVIAASVLLASVAGWRLVAMQASARVAATTVASTPVAASTLTEPTMLAGQTLRTPPLPLSAASFDAVLPSASASRAQQPATSTARAAASSMTKSLSPRIARPNKSGPPKSVGPALEDEGTADRK
jgi:serine/threonine protein kinase